MPTQKSKVRLWGAPSRQKFKKTSVGEVLKKSAKIHFDDIDSKNRLIAIEKLAIDIFNNPLSARAFAVNPDEYMRQAGFRNTKLDLNSNEVRIAMAMGDPDVSEAARLGDIKGFISAIERQGFKVSTGTNNIFAFAAVEVAVWFSAVAVSVAAAAYTVETAVSVHHKIGVAGATFLTKEHHNDLLVQIASHFGNKKFTRHIRSRAMNSTIQKYLELHEISLKKDAPIKKI